MKTIKFNTLVISLFLTAIITGFSIMDKEPRLTKSNPGSIIDINTLTNDVGIIEDSPYNFIIEDNGYNFIVDSVAKAPKTTVINFGTANQTNVPVTFKLQGAVNYSSTKYVNINSGDTVRVTFDSTFNPLDTGAYALTMYTGLATDQNRTNDTVRKTATAYKPNGGYGDMPCRYYFANSIAEGKYESRPVYCWENPTCYYPLITNGVNMAPDRYVGNPDMDDGYFKLKLRNILFACGADTSLKIKMCGQYFDSLFIGTNGLASFTLRDGQHNEFFSWPILATSPTQNYSIYPLWMDLIFKPGSDLTYAIECNKLIITWAKVTDFANQSKFVSFQAAYELVKNPSAIEPNIRFTYGNAPAQTSTGFVFGSGNFPFPLVGLYATNFLHYKMPFNRPVMSGSSGLAVEFGPSPFSLNKLGCCDPCICEGGILQNGNFANYILGTSSDLCPGLGCGAYFSRADPWYASFRSPQVVAQGGCCDSGFIRFWGKRNNGERISQSGLSIQAGRRYQISVCTKLSPSIVVNYGKIGVMFSNAPVTSYSANDNYNGNIIGGAIPLAPQQGSGAPTTPPIGGLGITSTVWTTYTYIWDATQNYTTINLNPLNNIDDDEGTVSWMDLDNICIKDIGPTPVINWLDIQFVIEARQAITSPDSIITQLRSLSPPYNVISEWAIIWGPGFVGSIRVPLNDENLGNLYYVVLKHRNSIETWSANPVMIGADSTAYDFTTSVNQAFGSNMVLVEGLAAIYGGDVNQDGSIDLSDVITIENDVTSFTTGNAVTDLDGNGIVDLSDLLIAHNNAANFVSVKKPF